MEVFQDIQGYEGYYQISNFGRVYSTPKDGKQAKFLKLQKVHSATTTYLRVSLSKDGKVKRFSVHRLVALHFLPVPLATQTVINHLDCNGSNNHYDNLQWCTQKENVQYAAALGHMKTPKKFTDQQLSAKAALLETKCKALLGDALISTTLKSRSTVTFYCSCGSIVTKRVDAAQSNPYCKTCNSKIRSDRQKGHTNSKTRGVSMYTLSGEFIKSYQSIAAARKETGDTNIVNVAQGRQKQSKGFIWKYTN